MVAHWLDDLPRGRTIWLHEVLNWGDPGGSSILAAFTHIELDVIVSNLRHAASLDIATLQGDFDWSYWRASLTDFQGFDPARMDESFAADQFSAVIDADEAWA